MTLTDRTAPPQAVTPAQGAPPQTEAAAAITGVRGWIAGPDPEAFPYARTLAAFRSVGKHFVAYELLRALDEARRTLGSARGPAAETLRRFLDVALDKYDETYDYASYTALGLLPPAARDESPLAWADRRVGVLLTDALRFELGVLDGTITSLPLMRPSGEVVVKRCRLALRAIRPMLARSGASVPDRSADPVESARTATAEIAGSLCLTERHLLAVSMQPVYVMHDEYLFIRVLQSFETLFAFQSGQIEGAVAAIEAGDPAPACAALEACARTFGESAPLFSLLATMQGDAFRTFRQFTEGASAIQSPNYKRLESLCRRPDDERLDSPAYRWVPGVRDAVVAGQPDLDGRYRQARSAGRLSAEDDALLCRTAEAFASAYRRWRTTHYRLAVRMLGTAPGTGYTEGTPYLRKVLDVPVFRALGSNGQDGTP